MQSPAPRATPLNIQLLVASVVVVAAAVLLLVPAWQLVVSGPFAWHVIVKQSWQGWLEGVALAAMLAFALRASTRWMILFLAVLPFALYARRHAIDVPAILLVIHLEVLIGLGMFVRRAFGRSAASSTLDYLKALATGVALWSLFAWTLSAIDFGSIKALRWLTALLLIPALLGGHPPLFLHLWRRLGSLEPIDRAWSGVLAAWLLVLMARTKTAIGYDSLWYGLRGEYVLAPGDSVFEPLALVSPVHYFPKLYEVLLLPFSAAGDTTIIAGFSVLLLVPLLMAVRLLMREALLPEHLHFPVLALVATLPALANIAGEPKPDVFATLFVMIAAVIAIRFQRSRSLEDGAWLLSCVALACCAKLTAIPYAGMLLIATLLSLGKKRVSCDSSRAEHGSRALAVMTFVIVAMVALFVVARTVLLAGLPTIGPDPLFRLWHTLGFELLAPAGTLNWTLPQDWSDVPMLIVDWLFRPQTLPHIVITWMGNVWLWLFVSGLAGAGLLSLKSTEKLPREVLAAFSALMLTGLVLAVAIRYHFRGSDGNYFLYALIPGIVMAASFAFRRLEHAPPLYACVLACLPCFALFQAGYSFVSGAWTPGTRALDTDFSRSWKEAREINGRMLEDGGVSLISRHLKSLDSLPRVVGRGEDHYMFRLPARYEDLAMISYSRPDYTSTADGLLHYMFEYDIDYLVLPNASTEVLSLPEQATAERAASMLARLQGTTILHDERYYMLDISGVRKGTFLRGN